MKKLLLFLSVACSSLLLHAQTNQVVWLNGKVLYEQPVSAIDSITYDMNNMITGDTLKLILPRATKEIVYKEIHDTVYLYKYVFLNENLIAGTFSVSADKQVAFTKGNLQYTQSTATWSFAGNQYDMIGTANARANLFADEFTLADKIDLFGWSANNETAKWGISLSNNDNDYAGDFVDWGMNIGDGTTYRTLTKDEWSYLLNDRTNASNLKGIARINLNTDGTQYANGLVVLPDSWTCPAGITFKSGFTGTSSLSVQAFADYQTFTLAQWQKLENAGAVFLPASGYRVWYSVSNVQNYGYYWSATTDGSQSAYYLYFYPCDANLNYSNRHRGQAVRLVKDL